MNRRDALKSAMAAGAVSVSAEAGWAASSGKRNSPVQYIETKDRTNLFYKDWGSGKPVVFVSGWSMNSDCWQYQMIHLASHGARCIAYDRRGHGRSSDPGRGYDYDTLAADLATVVDQLDLRGAVLVSHSMGAGEVIRYLTNYGSSRVARIVLVAPNTPFPLKTADNPDGIDNSAFIQLRASWMADFPKWIAGNARPFFTPETSPATVQWGERMCLQTSLMAAVECNRTASETDFRPELQKVTIPALIVHGDRDVSAPLELNGVKTAKLLKGSELKVYEGAPHGLIITHAEQLNRDLLSFIG